MAGAMKSINLSRKDVLMRRDWNIPGKIKDAIMEAREEIVIVSAKIRTRSLGC